MYESFQIIFTKFLQYGPESARGPFRFGSAATQTRGRISMIGHLTGFPDKVGTFICKGRATKADYDSVLVPAVLQGTQDAQQGAILL